MVEEQQHDIVESNIVTFVREIELKVLDGWQVSKINPGEVVGLYGGMYTVTMIRNDDSVTRLKGRAESVQERPRLDRAATLAKARAVKAALKASATE